MDSEQKVSLLWLVALALIGFVAVIAASVNDPACLPNAVYDHWPALPQSGQPTLVDVGGSHGRR